MRYERNFEAAREGSLSGLTRWLRGITIALSLLFMLVFLWVAAHRLRYPFEVDRMESGMLTSVWRLRHGFALYSAPSLQWAPFLYAPLFFYLSAAVTHVVGIQFAALRLVSIAATVGSFGLIFLLVWRETRRWAPALFAAGLFAALYPFVLAWYDVGRVDSLALFFFLAALLATRHTHPLWAGLLWWLAFLTKQTYLPLGLLLFTIEWERPRRMLTGMAAYSLLVVGSFAWLQHSTHGWFRYYAFGTAGVIKWSWHTAIMFPFTDLLGPLPIACGLIFAATLFTGLRWRERDGSYLLIVTVLLTGAIAYVRAHVGANLNAVIPLYAWMAVLSGISLDRLLERPAGPLPASALQQPGLDAQLAPLSSTVIWLLAAVQLGAHLYRPAEIHTGNLAARAAFISVLRHTPGDVWVVDHPFDAILAGKPLHADMDALDAVLGRGYAPAVAEFQQLIATQRLTAVVLDRTPESYEPSGIFTAAPFGEVYRVRAIAPGGDAEGNFDAPLLTFLPCDLEQVPQSLTDLHETLANRSSCAMTLPQ